MGDHRQKSRATAGGVAVFLGIVVTAFLIVTAVPAPRTAASVGAVAPGTAAQAPTRTPDEHLCLEVSSVVEDSAKEVERYRRDGRAERISRLQAAEDQLGHYSQVARPGLSDVVRELGNAIGGLRSALERGGDTWAATDAVLRRIDAFEAACGPGPAAGL